MKRNYFSRLLRRGRALVRGQRRAAWSPSRSSLALEALEDRRLLATGLLGNSLLVERLVPVTIEISFQQPTVVSQPTTSITFVQTGGAGLFSFLGQLSQPQATGTSGGTTSTSGSSGAAGGLLGGILNPVTSTVDSLLHGTLATVQPGVTNTTSVLQSTLLLVPNLLSAAPLPAPSPVAPAPSVSAGVTGNVTVPTPIRSNTSITLSSGAGQASSAVILAPDLPPARDLPSAPSESAPVVPPALPDTAPTLPTPAVDSVRASSRLVDTPAVAPLVVPPLTGPALLETALAPQAAAFSLVNAETAVPLANAAANQAAPLDFSLLLFGPTANTVAPTDSTPQSPVAQALLPNLEAGRAETPLAASAISGAAFVGLETYVFGDDNDPSAEDSVPGVKPDGPLSPGERNEVAVPPAAGETATLVGASDEILTQAAYGAAHKVSEAAKDLMAPASQHWLRYVAPVFIAAGAYIASRLARTKKTNEHRPPPLGLVR